MSKIIRIDDETYQKLQKLQTSKKVTKQDLLKKAVERMVRDELFAQMETSYIAYISDPKQRAEDEQEQQEWDSLSADGLEDA